MFDYDDDGHTDFMEAATGFAVMEKKMGDESESEFELDTDDFFDK